MMKNTIFLFLLIMLSCNNRTKQNDSVSVEVLVDHNYSIWDREPFADSTWYNLIVEAWEKRDTMALRPFFESWYQHTLKTDCTSDMPYRTVMDAIIRVIHEKNYINTPHEPDPAARGQEILKLEKSPLQELSLGDSILLFSHPAYWDSPSRPKRDYQPSSYELWFELLNSKFSDEYTFEKGLRCIYPKEVIVGLFGTKSDDFIDFSKITGTLGYGDSIVIYSNKLPYSKADLYTILFDVDIDCNNCEYGMSLRARAIISIKNQEIADIKLVDFVYGNSLSRSIRFCYFPNEILYIKNFGADEISTVFGGLEQYQVNEQGKFIRYYEQDGYQ